MSKPLRFCNFKAIIQRALHANKLRDSALVFLITVFATITGFISQMIVARLLTPAEFGYFSIGMGIIGVGTILGLCGADVTVLKFTIRYVEMGNTTANRRLFHTMCETLFLSIFIVITGLYLIGTPVLSLPPDPLSLVLLCLPLIIITVFLQCRMRGFSLLVRSFIPEGMVRPALFLLGVIILTILHKLANIDLSAKYIFMVLAAGACVACLTAIVWLYRAPVPTRGIFDKSNEERRQSCIWFSNNLSFLGINLASSMNTQIGVLIFGWLAMPVEAGIFGVVIRLSALVVFVLSVINMVYATTFVRAHTLQDTHTLRKAVFTAIILSVLCALPIAITLILFPDYILKIFGDNFQQGKIALQITATGFLINAALGPLFTSLTLYGYQQQVAGIQYIAITSNGIITYTLAESYGVNAAAWGTSTSLVILSIGTAILAFRSHYLRIYSSKDSP